MRRLLLIPAFLVVIWASGARELFAQQGGEWSAFPLKEGWSGPGFYLGWIKILAAWLVFLAWLRTVDWLSQDSQETGMGYQRWNPIAFGPFVAAFVLLWLIPYFWLGFPLLVIAYLAPVTTYVLYRNKRVEADERVFTPDHLRHWLAARLSGTGVKIETERQDPHETGPPVTLTARGGASQRDDNAHLLAARQAPGFRDARHVIAEGLFRRADAIRLDFTQQGVGIRWMIDGVWHNAEPMEREAADPLLEALKLLGGLNAQDRQSRQEGAFAAQYEKTNYFGTLASQGTKTGELAVIQLEDTKTHFKTFDDLGMRAKVQEQIKELTDLPKGFLLFSAMPASGLRSTMNVMLRSTDRLMRDFMAVEEEKHRYEEVENIPVTTYSAAEGQTALDILPKLFHQEPNVLVIRELANAETVSLLCREVEEDRLIISTMRAKDSAEALLRVLALKVPPAEFAKVITAVLNQRLIRNLCDQCKEAYEPTPQILQQLGIPQGRVEAFYRPPQQPEEVCPACNGVGYVGRTGLFELLMVDDTVRRVLASTPKLDLVRQAARKAGMRTLQEEGILLVAKGVTSLPELMRVLKQ